MDLYHRPRWSRIAAMGADGPLFVGPVHLERRVQLSVRYGHAAEHIHDFDGIHGIHALLK